jgi:heme exporter protein D
MSYAGYVIAAYGVFAVVLLWDFVAPRIRTRQLLRAVSLLARRQSAAQAAVAATTGELKR